MVHTILDLEDQAEREHDQLMDKFRTQRVLFAIGGFSDE